MADDVDPELQQVYDVLGKVVPVCDVAGYPPSKATYHDDRAEALRGLTVEKNGTPADKARDAGGLVVVAVDHEFQGGYLVRAEYEMAPPGERGRRLLRIDPDRCRTCGRPNGPQHGARPERGDGRTAAPYAWRTRG